MEIYIYREDKSPTCYEITWNKHFIPFTLSFYGLERKISVLSLCRSPHFVPIGLQTWPPHAILVSDWSISKKSSPLKLLSHMNRNLVGSIYMYGRFCIKFLQSRMKGERHRLSTLIFLSRP
jgi:hypothetical protein